MCEAIDATESFSPLPSNVRTAIQVLDYAREHRPDESVIYFQLPTDSQLEAGLETISGAIEVDQQTGKIYELTIPEQDDLPFTRLLYPQEVQT